MGNMKDVYIIFVGKPLGRYPQRMSRRRWQDNIRMDVGEISC
jgi:hypothetical protein